MTRRTLTGMVTARVWCQLCQRYGSDFSVAAHLACAEVSRRHAKHTEKCPQRAHRDPQAGDNSAVAA
jgi:hypothetical protein